MTECSDAIISIRPEYADAILSGIKTVELRRRIPSIQVGTRLWIYATRPVGAIVGTAIVKEVLRGTPDEIWAAHSQHVAVNREVFDAYYVGTKSAIGILLTDIIRRKHVHIETLRKIRNGFHPPQVLSRISKSDSRSFHKLAKAV